MTLNEWAARWNLPQQALQELLDMPMPVSNPNDQTEGAVQQDVRLEASRIGANLWRNNNGAGTLSNGCFLRWGLGNDSEKINAEFKTPDLIGITPMRDPISGFTYGVFTAIEIKHGGWYWTATEHEQAQWKYLQLIVGKGGFATFAKSIEDYRACLNITG